MAVEKLHGMLTLYALGKSIQLTRLNTALLFNLDIVTVTSVYF